jgi:hypothetical protein
MNPYILGASSAAAAAFVPTDIGGCVLWLRSDLGVTKDGGNLVSLVADQSTAGNNATQPTGGNKPLWVANQLNTYPCIRFDGATSYMLADGVKSSFINSTDPWSFFVVLKRNRNTDERVITASVTSSHRPIYQYAGWDGSYAARYNAVAGIAQSFADNVTTYNYYIGAFSGSTINVSKNGAVQLEDAAFVPEVFPAPLENFRIGVLEYGEPGNFVGLASMDLVEVGFFASNISTGDRAKLITYAQTRYGL